MRYWFLLGGLLLAPAGHAAVRVTDVSLSRDVRGWRVDVKASARAAYTVHALPSPDRLIIDLPGATLAINSQVKPVANAGSPALRYSQFTRKPDAVRIVVDLPATGAWREISASPAMNIAVSLPTGSYSPATPGPATYSPAMYSPATAAPRIARVTKPARATQTAKKAKTPRKASPPARQPEVLSARDLEREMLKTGQPIVPAVAKKSSPHSVRRKRTARHPAAPAPQPSRSAVSSRDGYVDRTDLMATMMSLPEVGVAPPEPETQPQPVAPSWTPDEAIALINETDCPEELRRRLIEVVSDPAIRTSHYVWGAETPGQFDCSGLALYIYNGLDVKLPRVSTKQAEAGVPVERADLRAGDLVFFNTRGTSISHVGIYLGGGRFLHAANPRANLQITGLDSAYYARRYVTARRVYNPSFASGNTIRQGG